MNNDKLKQYTDGRLDALKQYADSRFAIANARIDDAVRRSNAATLKLDCYDLATKAVGDGPLSAALDEAKRLHDWVTGRDEPASAADGSEDLGGRYGSLHPPKSYPDVG